MKLIILLFLFLPAGCDTTPRVMPGTQIQGNQAELVSQPAEMGGLISEYILPFNVDTPQNAQLDISFKIKSAGHCATSYQPTIFYLNKQKIAEFDFRRYFLKTTIEKSISINKRYFKQGANTFKIVTGECQYDIDILELNQLQLNFNKQVN